MVIFFSSLTLSLVLFMNSFPRPFVVIFSFLISIFVSFIYYGAIKNKVNSKFRAILLGLYAIIAFETFIFIIIVFIFSLIQSPMIIILWILLSIVGLYFGCKFYEYVKSSQLSASIILSRQRRSNEYWRNVEDLSFNSKSITYPAVLLIVLVAISLILDHFNLTFGFSLSFFIKVSALIASFCWLFFANKLLFKSFSLIMVLLIFLMIFVDVFEKYSYFGLSPDIMRFVLVVGGSTMIVVGGVLFYKWKMGEF